MHYRNWLLTLIDELGGKAVGVLIDFTAYMEWALLVLLLILSIWSVKIMIERAQVFKNQGAFFERLSKLLSSAGTDVQVIERLFRSAMAKEKLEMEKGLLVLATLGSNAPFIGLFGTVLGIIRAFAALSDAQGGATSVMAGISQALYATAAGLFVAIPAVIAFNYFTQKLKVLLQMAEAEKEAHLARVLKERK